MTSYWYFIHAATPAALESAPIYIVKVGETRRAAAAHARLAVRALDADFYYCIKNQESTEFYGRLREQNPHREIYEVTPETLIKIYDLDQNVANVKNLSDLVRRNERSFCLGHSKKSYYD